MAATGYTPILLYASGTATNQPLAANLTSTATGAELAINYTDGKLFYKDNGGTVQVIASKSAAAGSFTNLSIGGTLTDGSSSVGTSGQVLSSTGTKVAWITPTTTSPGGSNTQVQYNNSGAFAGSANMTFNGTSLTLANVLNVPSINGATTLTLETGGTTAASIDASQKLTVVNDASISGLTVGKGGGAQTTTVAIGQGAGAAVDTGSNVAVGTSALAVNTASNNTAVGYQSLYSNTTATNSIGIGYQTLYSLSNGTGYATAIGRIAGYNYNSSSETNGSVFIGASAGYNTTTGHDNTFVGAGAGLSVTTGAYNTILGGYTGNNGGLNITTSSNYIVLSDGQGNPWGWFDNSGNFLVPQAYNNTTPSGANGFIAGNGTFQRSTSSLKYKRDVIDAEHGLKDVMKLRSVIYKSKTEPNSDAVYGGLIAEEVDGIGLKEFVQYAADGSPDALSYGNMVALAFKAIQEQQAIIESLTTRIAALEAK